MATVRLRYQQGHLIPLDPLPGLKDGDEIEVELLVLPDSARSTMLASQGVLGRDWNMPEEDEAWRDL